MNEKVENVRKMKIRNQISIYENVNKAELQWRFFEDFFGGGLLMIFFATFQVYNTQIYMAYFSMGVYFVYSV